MSVGPVSQRAGGFSARGRSSSRSPAKEYDVTGTFDSLAQHLHSFSPLKCDNGLRGAAWDGL